ncbi:MAG TPA: glycosyltransferase family 39 protein [Vicinamibacteria bacterium]
MRPPRPLALLAVLALALAAQRARTFHEPFERDVMTYAVIGHELRLGQRLYTDVFDHKPPAVYATFAAAEGLAGYGPAAVYLVNVAFALLAMGSLFAVASRWMGGRAGVVAAVFWLVASYDLELQGNQPNTELCLNGLLAAAFASAFGGRSRRRLWAAGALVALASLYKPVALVMAPLWAAAFALQEGPRAAGLRDAARPLAALVLPGVMAWALLAAYFALDGRLDTLVTVLVGFNLDYAGSLWGNVAAGLRPSRLWPPALLGALPLLVLTVIGVLAATGSRWRRWVPVLASLAGAVVMVALPGHGWAHYYQLYLPPLVIGATLGLTEIEPRWGRRARGALLAAAVALLLAVHLPQLALDGDGASRRKYGGRFLAVREAARRASALRREGESVWVYGIEPGVYFHARTRPVTQVLWINHLTGPLRVPLRQALRRQLRDARPAVLVVDTRYSRDWVPAGVSLWMDEEYVRLPSDEAIAPFELRVRRDLARRVPP